jgi:hypothetical protein
LWNHGCTIGWQLWNEHYLITYEEEVSFQEASFNTIYGEDGRLKEGTTIRANIEFIGCTYKFFSYSTTNGRYSKNIFYAFRKAMVELG